MTFLQNRQRLLKRSLFATLILLPISFQIFLSVGQAQSAANSGQIGGEVRDPLGAAVVGLEVTARNIDTNATRTALTDEEGRYAIGPIPVGPYEVTVKPANMEAASERVYVSLGGRANATFKLGIKTLQESVEVLANNTASNRRRPFPRQCLRTSSFGTYLRTGAESGTYSC